MRGPILAILLIVPLVPDLTRAAACENSVERIESSGPAQIELPGGTAGRTYLVEVTAGATRKEKVTGDIDLRVTLAAGSKECGRGHTIQRGASAEVKTSCALDVAPGQTTPVVASMNAGLHQPTGMRIVVCALRN